MFTLHLYVVIFFSNFIPRYTVDFLSISFTWIAVAKFTAMYCVTSLYCSHAPSLLFCYDVISQYDLLCILYVLTRLNGFQFYETVVFPIEVCFMRWIWVWLVSRGHHRSESLSLYSWAWGLFLRFFLSLIRMIAQGWL